MRVDRENSVRLSAHAYLVSDKWREFVVSVSGDVFQISFGTP